MWTEHATNFFFNASPDGPRADEFFRQRYCSWRTCQHMNMNGINSNNLRVVLKRLSEIVPELEQSTPRWSRPHSDRLQVMFGRACLQRKSNGLVQVIRKPRFGVYGHEGLLYLWMDYKELFDDVGNPKFDGYLAEDWLSWPGVEDGKVYYAYPVLTPNGDWNELASLADGAMLQFLLMDIQDRVKSAHFALHESFAVIRSSQGVPDEFDVSYPRLSEQNASPPTRAKGEHNKLNHPADYKSTVLDQGRETEAGNDTNASPRIAELAESCAQKMGIDMPENYDCLIDSPEIKGRFYVYALVDPTNGSKPFYIGKGFHDRATQHFRALPERKTSDEREFDELKRLGVSQGGVHSSILDAELLRAEPAKITKVRALIAAGETSASIIRVIARGLNEKAALAIESLTIKSVYGQGNLTNEVSGHHDERFRPVCNWEYIERLDLPTDTAGNLLADDKQMPYVYVLREPRKGEIFYVGKGKGDRLCQHFRNARAANYKGGIKRLDEVKRLLHDGFKESEIGRIVARLETDALAFVIESFYVKFVIGFESLSNIQPGHLYGMFRSHGDWAPRYGFDLSTEAGGQRRELLDAFLGEGLDTIIYEILASPDLSGLLMKYNAPRLYGAGELGVFATMTGVNAPIKLRIQVRCARRIQVFLMPIGQVGRKWMHERFQRLCLVLRRQDGMFSPGIWSRSNNLAIDTATASQRAIRLVRFAQALQSAHSLADLEGFLDLVVGYD